MMKIHAESSLHNASETDNTHNHESQLLDPPASPECAHSDASRQVQHCKSAQGATTAAGLLLCEQQRLNQILTAQVEHF
jgi:hypothetical protein